MVFIHGGGFYFGSSSSRVYGADYLVAQGVVLVTINYRLGPQGQRTNYFQLKTYLLLRLGCHKHLLNTEDERKFLQIQRSVSCLCLRHQIRVDENSCSLLPAGQSKSRSSGRFDLMMEAAGTSEMSVNFHQTTRRNNTEDRCRLILCSSKCKEYEICSSHDATLFLQEGEQSKRQ
jgi:hypothetical protein